MWSRIALLLLGTVSLANAERVNAQQIVRGRFFRSEKFGFQLWLPSGFDQVETDKVDEAGGWYQAVATFRSAAAGLYHVNLIRAKQRDMESFADSVKEWSEADYPGRPCERVYEVSTAGGHPAAVLVTRSAFNTKKKEPVDAITLAMKTASGCILYADAYCLHKRAELGLKQVRWMIGTYTCTGPSGLDWFLHSPEIDLRTGLAVRWPRGCTAVPLDTGAEVLRCVDPTTGDRLEIAPSAEADPYRALRALKAGRKRGAHVRFEHPMASTAVGAFHVSGSGESSVGRAALAIEFKDHGLHTVSVIGKASVRARLMRTAEFVSYGLRFIDVAQARQDADIAALALKRAVARKDWVAAESHLERLCDLTFLSSAREALGKALPKLQLEQDCIRVARALAGSESPDVYSYLQRGLKSGRLKQYPDVINALLEGLGRLGNPRSISLLLRHADRGEFSTRAAAVRALGNLTEERRRVAGELLRRLKRLVTSGSRGRPDYDRLKAAYKSAFHSLLGARHGTVDEVEYLLRKKEE